MALGVHALLKGDVVTPLRLVRVALAHLRTRPLSASYVVDLELIEGFAGSGEDNHARTGRYRGAAGEQDRCAQREQRGLRHGYSGLGPFDGGTTFIQPAGHCWTYG
jgi:hypothetical protein